MEEIKKIGILTYIYAINHGSLLQAKAVENIVKQYFPGSEVKFINYAPKRGLLKELRHNIINKRFVGGLLICLRFYNVLRKFNFWNPILITDSNSTYTNLLNKLNLDFVFIGSDTVWESRPKGVGYAPPPLNPYFISKVSAIKTKFISIAASSDRSLDKLWPESEIPNITSHLKEFNLISVRDKFTKDLLLNKFKTDSNLVPDPTFFVNHDEIINKLKLSRILRKMQKTKFIIIDIADRKLSKQVSNYFKQISPNYLIIAPMTNRYADINLRGKINPLDWAWLHYNAIFVVTNRFHGTIFSIKGRTPFISIDQSFEYSLGAGSKKYDLLKRANMLENYISIDDTINILETIGLILNAKSSYFESKCNNALLHFRNEWDNFLNILNEN